MPPKPVKIKQPDDPKQEVPTEILAKAIVEISEGIKVLRRGPIKDSALLILIQNAAPNIDGRPIPLKTISAVLEGAEDLAKVYLKSVK
jgi:hypothetical protein